MRRMLMLLVLMCSSVVAQDAATQEVRARYAECNALEKQKATRSYEFQRVLQGDDFGPWRKAIKDTDNVWEYMLVYASAGRVRSVRLERSSPSGDWGDVTTYCYRANGSLAFRYQVLSTFYNDSGHGVEVQLRSYFGATGKNFKTLERILDYKTRKPVNTTYMGNPPPDFLTSGSVVKTIGPNLLPLK